MSVMNMYIILAYFLFLYCVIFYLYMYIFDKMNLSYLLKRQLLSESTDASLHPPPS